MAYKKKLIEVALPLPEINDASAYDKMPGIGPHPKGIHHWWARLPLPTARAVLFASVVDDPSAHPEKWESEEQQNSERERLFEIIRRMMGKKLHEHPEVYAEAHAEMLKHCDGELPPVFDPFAGGGSIPLEANRLGFESHAGDLNPVAVLLNKCNLELAPTWGGRAPVNKEDRKRIGGTEAWQGTNGLAADLRYYGRVIRDRAREKIGHLYPRVRLPKESGGAEATVIAWIWARTVASPNPAASGKPVPLISTYWLSSKKGKEVWLEPVVDKTAGTYRFEVKTGTPNDRPAIAAGTKAGRGARFICLLTGEPIGEVHIKEEASAGRLGNYLLAIVAEVPRGKVYLSAGRDDGLATTLVKPADSPRDEIEYDSRYLTPPGYGMTTVDRLFTPRQLTAMVTLSDLVKEVNSDVRRDAIDAGLTKQEVDAYAGTIATFLALALDRCADFNNALSTWKPSGQQQMHLFTRSAISMVWDFAEANLLGEKAICWHNAVDITADAVETIALSKPQPGSARQIDAATGADGLRNLLVSTDPPYYDNVPYADISDFFYVWLRRTVGPLYSELFSTLLVPKMPELTASPGRFGGDRQKATEHFESGFRNAFTALREKMDSRFPLTVYYAFKQDDEESGGTEETDSEGRVDLTTGWETLLESLISSGFQITATWPVRASQKWRMRAMGSNALASYVVLACRPRPAGAEQTDRRSFIAELKRKLPPALRHLQQGNIAPVDFAQAAIGPGMAVYSQYRAVLESNGQRLTVRTALGIINNIKDELLGESLEEVDKDTRWAALWFDEVGFEQGEAGQANLLANAQATAINGLVAAGIIQVKGDKVRLLRAEELPKNWDPTKDGRLTVWEMTHHLLRLYYYEKAGDEATAELLRRLGAKGEIARDLAYRLFNVSEKRKRSQEAQGYNALVLGWPEIARLARESGRRETQQEIPFA